MTEERSGPEAENIWGVRAERLLERALYEVQNGDDAIGTVSAALAALQIAVGELPADELEGYPFPGEAPTVECICPPDLLARGGFRGGCLVHSALAIVPEEEGLT